MRKSAIAALTLALVASAPVVVSAQTDDDARRTAEMADREDQGEWGWLGLLGLAGLLGLKRRENVITRDRAGAATR